MEPAIDDLMVKIKAIAKGPNAELLCKLVDVLYAREQPEEQYDDEPLSPEELAAIEEADEAKRRGDKDYFVPWEVPSAMCSLRMRPSFYGMWPDNRGRLQA